MNNLHKLALFRNKVIVFREKDNNLVQIEINTEDLVPGDVFRLQNNTVLPCDCLIISGQAMVDECTLTGESIPVKKFQPIQAVNANNYMFHGNTLIQAPKLSNVSALKPSLPISQ